MPREHGADGTYVETTPPERVFGVFDAVDGPVILSADVADTLGCSRQTARRKLADLYDRGELDRRKVSRRVIYWKPGEAGGTELSADNLQGDADTTLADLNDTAGESDRTCSVIDLAAISFDRDLTDAQHFHLEEWLRHAAEVDGVSKSDFEDWWLDDRRGETRYSAGSFWEAFAKAAMKQSDQFTKLNTRTYRYTGDTGGANE